MLGFLIRLAAPTLTGCVLALVVAANWPDPSSPTAGFLIGGGGSTIGGVIGWIWAVGWAVRHEDNHTNP